MLDRIVAVVNDDIITLSELEDSGKEYLDRVEKNSPPEKLDDFMEQARDRILTKLITQRLISQQAKAANIGISERELTKSYEDNLKQMGVTREQFLQKLEETGLSEERYKSDLRNKILRDKLIHYEVRSKVVVTDEMVEEYYKEEYTKEVQEGGYYLLQMGFSWESPSQSSLSAEQVKKAKEKAFQQAERVRKKVMDGEDFGALARKNSNLPSAADGGDLGVFQKDELAPYMRETILALAVGDISPIIETPIGYQFFKLLSRQSGDDVELVPFESVKNDLRLKLFEKEFEETYAEWVESIKQDSYIQKML